MVACVSGVLVYDVSRLEDPFRSGICSEFAEGVFIVAAPFVPLCGIDVAAPVRAPGEEACRAILCPRTKTGVSL